MTVPPSPLVTPLHRVAIKLIYHPLIVGVPKCLGVWVPASHSASKAPQDPHQLFRSLSKRHRCLRRVHPDCSPDHVNSYLVTAQETYRRAPDLLFRERPRNQSKAYRGRYIRSTIASRLRDVAPTQPHRFRRCPPRSLAKGRDITTYRT